MIIPIHQVDAFADRPFTGNPAAVCQLDSWLPDELLQSIAQENNLSETAFTVKSEEGYRIRWFTPVTEVDLCGHATLAAAHVIFGSLPDSFELITFQSRSGSLSVRRIGATLTLDFPALRSDPCDAPQILISGLRNTPKECYRGADYLCIYQSEGEIVDLSPDFHILQKLETRGIIVSAPGDSTDFVSRFFAPAWGINEDPVTGSAHCLLAPYWAKKLQKNDMSAIQLSPRRGTLQCRIYEDRVLISGTAITFLTGSIQIQS